MKGQVVTLGRTFVSLIVVTVILLSGVGYLVRENFANRTAIEEQKTAITEQLEIIKEQSASIAEQFVIIEGQRTAIETQKVSITEQTGIIEGQGIAIEGLELYIQSLESDTIKMKTRIKALEAEWERLEALGGYREFGSLTDLRQWLQDDPISENEYIVTYYDCDDFAMDLTLAAIRDGHWIGLVTIPGHLRNFTIIGNNMYEIEPQTDGVTYFQHVDREA